MLRSLTFAVIILTAGCTAPHPQAPAPPPSGDAERAARAAQTTAPVAAERVVYNFTGTLIGAAPPNPLGSGPLLNAGRMDSFTVPNGTTRLNVSGAVRGDGAFRWEIQDAAGQWVFRAQTVLLTAPAGYVDLGGEDTRWFDASPAPGSYALVYEVGGSADVSLTLTALLPHAS